MSSLLDRPAARRACGALVCAALLGMVMVASQVQAQSPAQAGSGKFTDIGRAATPAEVKAWDIDVRPDFKGLPPGSGSVKAGQQMWESKCASCHGVFGEATHVFNPLVGGTTAQDSRSGRTARLADPAYPARSTMMKLSSLSTLWDYIARAMPWNDPKSLATDEVYALTAYMLHLADAVPQDFTLSDKNMAAAQALLPNRDGKTTAHAMWPGRGLAAVQSKPDVQGSACMKDCAAEVRIASTIPDYARDAHGNLSEQNRLIGAQRGVDTSRPAAAAGASILATAAAGAATTLPSARSVSASARDAQALAQRHGCTGCHAQASKLIGPSWAEISARHAGKAPYLVAKIKSGSAGQWGSMPMPPQTLGEGDAKSIAAWLAAGTVK